MCGRNNPEEAEICGYCQARLRPLQAEPPPEPTAGETGLGWLEDLRRHAPEDAPQETDEAKAEAEPGPPPQEGAEWLERIGLGEQPGQEGIESAAPQDAAQAIAPEEGRPAFDPEEDRPGGEAEPGAEAESSPAGEPQPEAGAEELPEWLIALGAQAQTPGAEAVEEAAQEEQPADAGSEIPEWLQAFEAKAAAPESPLEEAQPAAEEQPFTAQETSSESGVETRGAEAAEMPIEAEGVSVAAELPDWLRALAETPAPEAEAAAATEEQAAAEETTAGWAAEEPPAGEAVAESPPPFAAEEEIDWLETGALAEEISAAEELAAAPEGLAPAQLPQWLEALRPPEAALPGSAEEAVEPGSGPLAGLAGILPLKESAVPVRKPGGYPLDLQASEKQRLQSALFERMLVEEAQPAAAPAARGIPRQAWLRLVIALLLIGLVLAALLADGANPFAGLHPAAPAAAASFYHQVEALPAGAAVLLAVEYEPGFAAEMRFAAQGTLERLMQKNTRLASVSTIPTGPVLAEQLLQAAHDGLAARDPAAAGEYALAERSASLGYLPGGITSLQEFALRPQQATGYIPALRTSGQPAWEHPALKGVSRVSDFAMVVVLTDKYENGQAWIEQVAPALAGAPLLLVTSAQAAPLLQPYLASGQAQGMLAGLAGGEAYRDLSQGPGGASACWAAYQFGLLLAAGLALAGALAEAGKAIVRRRRQSEGRRG